MSLVPEVEVFETKATNLYMQLQGMDRSTAIYTLTRELLITFRDGGVSALTATRAELAAGKKP